MDTINPTAALTQALLRVESKSIRAWVTTDHNLPIWTQIAQTAIKNGIFNPDTFAAYVVCVALEA